MAAAIRVAKETMVLGVCQIDDRVFSFELI